MRLLIDECLSVDLVTVATQAGYEAHHVAHVGKASWNDWNVARHARDGDFILVTNNAVDFRKIYAREPIHPGLVIITPNVIRTIQCQLFRGALAELAARGDLINHVLEVDLDHDEATFTMYALPAAPK
ncbi:MAG TPA: DUF5615 family PIN-like protein [Acetobacteraceae bacterium]|nr:DUF5615 family PIN-like protein [Acetobacteraceae bacterium]